MNVARIQCNIVFAGSRWDCQWPDSWVLLISSSFHCMLQFSEINPKLTEEVSYVCDRWKAGYVISTRNGLVGFFWNGLL